MHFTARYTPEQWAEARRLRAEGLTFTAIAERLGFKSASALGWRARKESWANPRNGGGAARKRAAKRRPSPLTTDIRRVLALRLYSLLDLRIRMMELQMKKQLDAYQQTPAGAEPPAVTKDERASFAALIESINQITEMASEPASAADGGRKYAINPELTALSEDIDPDGLAIASEKDALSREIAERLAKLLPPA